MAEIQKRTETVVKNFYRLDLSQEEAEVLYVVLGKISGDPEGYRGITGAIFGELNNELGMLSRDVQAHSKLIGSLTFTDIR
jgi:hypothetical protein